MGIVPAFVYPVNLSVCEAEWKSLYTEVEDRNSISNKALHSQCPPINDLLTTLATSDWTLLSQLLSVSNRQSDELDGFSGRCGLVLERERKRERQ